MGLGAVGAGIYAFFNRLLIPTGLHHALNNVFWFNLANINDIGKFWGSADPASGAVIATGGFHPFGVYVTGIYQAGFFPIMMFGCRPVHSRSTRTPSPRTRRPPDP